MQLPVPSPLPQPVTCALCIADNFIKYRCHRIVREHCEMHAMSDVSCAFINDSSRIKAAGACSRPLLAQGLYSQESTSDDM